MQLMALGWNALVFIVVVIVAYQFTGELKLKDMNLK